MNFKLIGFLLLSIQFNLYAQGVHEDDAPALFDNTILHEVRIESDVPNIWEKMEKDKAHRDETLETTYTRAKVTIDGVIYPDAGFRYKGQSSYDFTFGKKKSLKVDFSKFGKSEKHQGYKMINLLNNFKDPTMLRELIYSEMMQRMGLPAPMVSFAKVYVNGEYFGLYSITEQLDDEFCERVFGNSDGNLYKGQPSPSLLWLDEERVSYKRSYMLKEQGHKEEFTDLVELLATIDDIQNRAIPEAEYIQRLDGILNTKDVLKAWAVNNFLMNIDAYNMFYQHNFYMYNNPYSGKWEWVSYDGNYALGTWNPKYPMQTLIDFPILYANTDKYPESLVEKMLTIPYYKRMYLDQYYIMVQWFRLGEWKQEVESYAALIRNAVYEDKHKETTTNNFEKGRDQHIGDVLDPGAFVPGLYPFMEARLKSVRAQLQKQGYVLPELK